MPGKFSYLASSLFICRNDSLILDSKPPNYFPSQFRVARDYSLCYSKEHPLQNSSAKLLILSNFISGISLQDTQYEWRKSIGKEDSIRFCIRRARRRVVWDLCEGGNMKGNHIKKIRVKVKEKPLQFFVTLGCFAFLALLIFLGMLTQSSRDRKFSREQKTVLLAPTGRAAKVFSYYSDHPAFTIHKKIYRQHEKWS